jgi:hypothetical protein
MALARATLPATSLLVAAGLMAAEPAGAAPGAPGLVAHRAVYDLTLGATRGSTSVETVRGRIVYDFSGSACKGYVLKFRQVTEIGVNGGGTNMSDLRSSTVEDAAGKTFRFSSQNFVNDKLDSSIDGHAEREPGGAVAVSLEKPSTAKFELPDGVIFPTGQTMAIVEAAERGDNVYESSVYDGSDGGRKVYSTLAVIGRKIPADKPREGAAAGHKELDGIDRFPVNISYFDPAKP